MADAAPVAFNFKQAITNMVQRSGSDLLLKVGRPATIRVNGELVALDTQPLKPEELKSLAEQIMTPRQVKEFAEHKEADFAIGVPGVGRFRTNVYQQRGAVQVATPLPMPAIIPGGPAPRVSPPQGMQMIADGEVPAAPEPPKPTALEVKSPMVGTFYKSPEPGAKAYVGVGDRVSKGQIVCIIEAMKIMNEIESDHSGVVREILVQDAQPVEYGQVLFKIDPNG